MGGRVQVSAAGLRHRLTSTMQGPACSVCNATSAHAKQHAAHQHHGGQVASMCQRGSLQTMSSWSCTARPHQHYGGQVAKRVLRCILQVVLVRRNLLHQPLRAHCGSQGSRRADGQAEAECREWQTAQASLAKRRHAQHAQCSAGKPWAYQACQAASRCICSALRAVWSERLTHCGKQTGEETVSFATCGCMPLTKLGMGAPAATGQAVRVQL